MSLHHLARQLSAQGRGPDTELVHMTKGELAGLHSLARSVYGQNLPVNPHTGLHEAGWLKSLLPTIVGGAVSYFTGSSGLGAAAGAATGAVENKDNRLMGAISGGIGGYGGGQLGAAVHDQGGISSLDSAEGWKNLLGTAAVKDPKTGAITTPATGLGGGRGALFDAGMGIAAPLMLNGGLSGGSSKSPAKSDSSIMQDPNAPASYRLVRSYAGGVKPPNQGESSERNWFDWTYEPTGLVPGHADGGAVDNGLPSSEKAYRYLHNLGPLDKPGAGTGTTPGTGTSGGTDASTTPGTDVKSTTPSSTYPVDPGVLAKIKADGDAGKYYDPDKLAAALAATKPGADGRTVLGDDAWMSALKPVSGLKMIEAPTKWDARTDLPGGGDVPAGEDMGYYKDANGQTFKRIKGADGDNSIYVQYNSNNGKGFNNVTGSDHDKVQPVYKLDPTTGAATPISAGTSYNPSAWVDYGRTLAEMAAVMGTVGVGGAALAGYGPLAGIIPGTTAAGAGTVGTDMMGATVGSGAVGGEAAGYTGAGALVAPTNAATIESAVNSGGYGASSSGLGTGATSPITSGGGTLANAAKTAIPYVKGAGSAAQALAALKGQQPGTTSGGSNSNTYDPFAPDETGGTGGHSWLATKHAEGGIVSLQSGGFVFPADVVSAVGAGSSSAGLEMLAQKFGATPVSGTGHGQSDDVEATIDGQKPARVARDEAVLNAEQVAQIGGGDPKKGAKKLYDMMARVRKQSMGRTLQMRPINVDSALR